MIVNIRFLITSIVLPLPGGPNNRIPRTGARRPVNIYQQKQFRFFSIV